MRMYAALLAGLLTAVGCEAPKYVRYTTEAKDASFQVPWGWSVYEERQGNRFYEYRFAGPFDPEFYQGVPSFVVRWYSAGKTRTGRNGLRERYRSARDFVRRVPREIYGRDRQFVQKPRRISVAGWEARNFIVESVAELPDAYHFGVHINPETGRGGIIRKHAYVVLPMDTGFYVMIYPATRGGYPGHEKKFNHLVNTFKVLTDGPGGKRI